VAEELELSSALLEELFLEELVKTASECGVLELFGPEIVTSLVQARRMSAARIDMLVIIFFMSVLR
jgi:hypothetical protein